MDKKRLLILGGLLAVVIAIAVAAVVVSDSGDESGEQARQEDTGGGGNALGVCVEGVPDCVDTVVNHPDGGDVADEEPPLDPDTPVTSEPGAAGGADVRDCTSDEYADVCREEATKLAVGDLAARLDVASEAIAVVSVESAVWDGCMGVPPAPGNACPEIGIIGYKIILDHTGVAYEYHTDTGGRTVLAE